MKVWILFGILACIAWQANSAALDDYQDGKNIDKIATFLEQTPWRHQKIHIFFSILALDEEELNHLMNYIGTTETRMEK